MYRCAGCDAPVQERCDSNCVTQQETKKPEEKKINIASGEDVALWMEELEEEGVC